MSTMTLTAKAMAAPVRPQARTSNGLVTQLPRAAARHEKDCLQRASSVLDRHGGCESDESPEAARELCPENPQDDVGVKGHCEIEGPGSHDEELGDL